MKKTVFHTGGASLALYLTFDLIFLAIPFISIRGLIRSFSTGDITYIIGDVASLILVVYLTKNLVVNEVAFSQNSVLFREADGRLLARTKSAELPFAQMEAVTMGDKGFLLDALQGKRQGLDELKAYYAQFAPARAKKGAKAPVIPPVMAVEAADGKFCLFSSRPYSGKELKEIFARFAAAGVKTSVQPGILP